MTPVEKASAAISGINTLFGAKAERQEHESGPEATPHAERTADNGRAALDPVSGEQNPHRQNRESPPNGLCLWTTASQPFCNASWWSYSHCSPVQPSSS